MRAASSLEKGENRYPEKARQSKVVGVTAEDACRNHVAPVLQTSFRTAGKQGPWQQQDREPSVKTATAIIVHGTHQHPQSAHKGQGQRARHDLCWGCLRDHRHTIGLDRHFSKWPLTKTSHQVCRNVPGSATGCGELRRRGTSYRPTGPGLMDWRRSLA